MPALSFSTPGWSGQVPHSGATLFLTAEGTMGTSAEGTGRESGGLGGGSLNSNAVEQLALSLPGRLTNRNSRTQGEKSDSAVLASPQNPMSISWSLQRCFCLPQER